METFVLFSVYSVENSLQCLVGILSGSDSDLQLEAVWCVTNIAAGMHDHAMLIIKNAAPYLITFLSSSSPELQVCQTIHIENMYRHVLKYT